MDFRQWGAVMKESLAKELFEAWWSKYENSNRDKDFAWEAFKKGIKVAEAYWGDKR